jgi:hypothetical protein
MPDLRIDIENGRTACAPGDTLAGHVTWSVDRDPSSAELRLFWYTSGKGTQNVGVVQTVPFDRPQRSDRRDFRMILPLAPYSCSGTLVSIVWAMELIVEPGSQTERVELTIAPGGNEVVLGSVTSPT